MEVTTLDVERRLRFAGLRVTRSRTTVLAAVHAHPHADRDMVVDAARRTLPDLSRQGVHDALRALIEVGLVRRFQLGSMVRFEAQTGDDHHHVVCTSCGRIADVDCAGGHPPCLSPVDSRGFIIRTAEVVYQGLCQDCAGQSDEHPWHRGAHRDDRLPASHTRDWTRYQGVQEQAPAEPVRTRQEVLELNQADQRIQPGRTPLGTQPEVPVVGSRQAVRLGARRSGSDQPQADRTPEKPQVANQSARNAPALTSPQAPTQHVLPERPAHQVPGVEARPRTQPAPSAPQPPLDPLVPPTKDGLPGSRVGPRHQSPRSEAAPTAPQTSPEHVVHDEPAPSAQTPPLTPSWLPRRARPRRETKELALSAEPTDSADGRTRPRRETRERARPTTPIEDVDHSQRPRSRRETNNLTLPTRPVEGVEHIRHTQPERETNGLAQPTTPIEDVGHDGHARSRRKANKRARPAETVEDVQRGEHSAPPVNADRSATADAPTRRRARHRARPQPV